MVCEEAWGGGRRGVTSVAGQRHRHTHIMQHSASDAPARSAADTHHSVADSMSVYVGSALYLVASFSQHIFRICSTTGDVTTR